MKPRRFTTLLFGSDLGIAGTVYGTIVVMSTLAAGSSADPDAWRLAVFVLVSVTVFWLAHVYSHTLAESIQRGHRLDVAELRSVARRELAIVLAAVAPIAALVAGALDLLEESTAIWLAMLIGLATLAVTGARYATIEQLSRTGTVAVIAINLAIGLVIVGLKAGLAH
jgi:hypothetical protein